MLDTEQVIDDFFEGSPRADELRRMRDALSDRLRALRRQRAESGDDAPRLTAQIAAMERQIEALKTEEAVSQFVEDSIKVTLAKAEPEEEEP